jgi:hypothetical protein
MVYLVILVTLPESMAVNPNKILRENTFGI